MMNSSNKSDFCEKSDLFSYRPNVRHCVRSDRSDDHGA